MEDKLDGGDSFSSNTHSEKEVLELQATVEGQVRDGILIDSL